MSFAIAWVDLEIVILSKSERQIRYHIYIWNLEKNDTDVRSLGQKDPLQKEMATCFSILAWRIHRSLVG